MSAIFLAAAYLAASTLFILDEKCVHSPETTWRDILLAEIGMLLAVVSTLLHGESIQYQSMLVGLPGAV